MSMTQLKNLVEKLDQASRQSLEAATARCQSRSHYSVEIEHWLDAMLEQAEGDIPLVLRSFNIDIDVVKQQLQQALESMKTGNNALPTISVQLINLLRVSWLCTSIEFADQQIRSAYLLYTLLKDESMAALLIRRVPALEKIDAAELLLSWPNLAQQGNK